MKGHIVHCAASANQTHTLEQFWITGGSGTKLTSENVREYVALWVAESPRPFSIVGDNYVSSRYVDLVKTLMQLSTAPEAIAS
jgi:hypothetical protein